MAVNDEIFKNLEVYGGGTINERVYNFLGSLGYTGTISDRLAKYSYEDKKGWQALIARYAGSGWTPAQLFSQGQQGVWYEPRPEYLYQDAAGTVPVTADGDPVGYMQDLSGNGNHATQSTSASRPVYPGLVYDGVDDGIEMPSASAPIGSVVRCTILALKIDNAAQNYKAISWGSGTDDFNAWRVGTNQTDGVLRIEIQGGNALGVTNLADAQWHIVSAWTDGPTLAGLHMRVDGEPETISNPSSTAINTVASAGFIGQRFDGSFWDGDIGPVFHINSLLQISEITEVERRIADIIGKTL